MWPNVDVPSRPALLIHVWSALAEPVRPGVPVAEIEALGGAAADREDGQVVPKGLGRLGATKPERVLGVNDGAIELLDLRVVYFVPSVNGQGYLVAPDSEAERILEEAQAGFEKEQGQNRPQE
jgi:hypothetical protein